MIKTFSNFLTQNYTNNTAPVHSKTKQENYKTFFHILNILLQHWLTLQNMKHVLPT